MNTYYATKSYVLRLTEGLYEENRREKSSVCISVLCPGPVATNFYQRAGGHFSVKPLPSAYVARYAILKMFAKKRVIIPSFSMKVTYFLQKLMPTFLLLKVTAAIQKRKL